MNTIYKKEGVIAGAVLLIIAVLVGGFAAYRYFSASQTKPRLETPTQEAITGSVSISGSQKSESATSEPAQGGQETPLSGVKEILNVFFNTIRRGDVGFFKDDAVPAINPQTEILKPTQAPTLIPDQKNEPLSPKPQEAILTKEEVFQTLYPDSFITAYEAQQGLLVEKGALSSGSVARLSDENALRAHARQFNTFLVSEKVIAKEQADRADRAWDTIIQRSFQEKQARAIAIRNAQKNAVQPRLPTAAEIETFYDFLEKNKPGIRELLPPVTSVPVSGLQHKGFLASIVDYILNKSYKKFIKIPVANAACGCSYYAFTPPVCFQAGSPGPGGIIIAPVCYGAYFCGGTCYTYIPIGCNELVQYPSHFVGPSSFLYDPTTLICGFAK